MPYLLAIALILGFGSAWKIQDWRQESKEKSYAEQKLAEVRSAAAATIRRADNVIQAQNDAQTRISVLRMDATNSRIAVDRLRDTLDASMRESNSSIASCVERTITISELLNQCAKAYRELGEVADRHTSDIQTLRSAWPK